MFGIDLEQPISDLTISKEKDAINFAKVISLKLEKVSTKKIVVRFFKELLENCSEELNTDQFS